MINIKQMISNGKIDEALAHLNDYLAQHPDSDEAYFLRGNAYSKKNDFRLALNNYLRAMELNPDSPARQAHALLMKIMEFYNKDMYNH